jgi:aminomethyltransferase
MPVSYPRGPIEEHRLVRRSAGLFDVSHMGRFRVAGRGAAEYLDRLVTSRLSDVQDHQSAYALLCRDDGGVLDDLFVYRLPGYWLVVANAANREKDHAWFKAHLRPSEQPPIDGVELSDITDETAMFALQGPRSLEVIDRLTDGKASRIPRFGSAELTFIGLPQPSASLSAIVGRTGYTGEDGVELFVASEVAETVWVLILHEAERAGIEAGPIGLAARDSLRFEPGFPLYGHELTEEVTPLAARLGWACDLDKEFIGRDALALEKERGVARRLATVRMVERGVPREGYRVLSDGREVGHVASGMYAPTVDAYCANVFLPAALAKVGTEVHIDIRGRARAAVVVKRPLYRPAYR